MTHGKRSTENSTRLQVRDLGFGQKIEIEGDLRSGFWEKSPKVILKRTINIFKKWRKDESRKREYDEFIPVMQQLNDQYQTWDNSLLGFLKNLKQDETLSDRNRFYGAWWRSIQEVIEDQTPRPPITPTTTLSSVGLSYG